MYGVKYDTDNKKFSLFITITCKGKKSFRVWAEDHGKRNSRYADRVIEVNGDRTIHINFPVSPKAIFLGVLNAENPKDTEYQVTTMEAPLTTYNIWLDEKTKKFLSLALYFSQTCGFKAASDKGRLFTSGDNEFVIKYFNVIRDYRTGKAMNTPARIGHTSGIIEAAKVKYDGYTIPMRMMITLHEYAHKNKNPKIGLEIGNEIGADINALYIYLGLGFSKVDAICVFANVFLKAQTKGNIERMRKIMDYIQKFENQEFAQKN
jgi:hypothetical protein